ncbi:MAG: hypothetical protein KO206_04335 [Methanomicrobiaceae archaeon]|uniref:Uncharacterized protein n=1 Tax=hydrocarbon metagenome TaxID=938273 RepID=A0A0W8FH35_9ZZZZ|nr:hypothetical protein [Methanomicrobiaceae archaeon]MDD5419450.1 hypothetical protein [Methanomicrobiaceae archaeon]
MIDGFSGRPEKKRILFIIFVFRLYSAVIRGIIGQTAWKLVVNARSGSAKGALSKCFIILI